MHARHVKYQSVLKKLIVAKVIHSSLVGLILSMKTAKLDYSDIQLLKTLNDLVMNML